jgi:cellulose synthase/poly-beta-1,6-N-acetylglucosamine synthase-like glycosyltransferase
VWGVTLSGQVALQILYILLITPLVLYACSTFALLAVYVLRSRRRAAAPPIPDADLPPVTVQIPLYNERYVAERAIRAAAALDYPRLQIQVLDDSTDDTTAQVSACVDELIRQGVDICLIHRTDRRGYKAGALDNGLRSATGEFIAVFDADFVPAPDFLRRTVPHFADPGIGVVQARWGHLNPNDSLLTRAQALMIDGHFAIEQFSRWAGGLIFTFNGTGGLWRRACIEDAGGWQHDTLTEDFDLSLRAHMRGWRFAFLTDVVVPGEIPAQMTAFKQQQARWAQGTTQVMLKHTARLLRSSLPLHMRIMGVLQMLPYPTQLLALCVLLIMPILILTDSLGSLPLGVLGVAGAAVPILYVLSQHALYRDWWRRIWVFPLLLVLSSGMMVNNARAAWRAFRRIPTPFERTPKLGDAANGRDKVTRRVYTALRNPALRWEVGFGIYAVFGALVAARHAPSMMVYFLLVAVSLFGVAMWSVMEWIN